ncbi:MAG: hypothetical protein JJU28_23330 [Cyclobacteriaceae bacterium]|nr:hypothetical protein [Cyclobacteriaceae bacterium]
MKTLMRGFLAVVLMTGLGFSVVHAQDDEQITDQELYRYALMNEVIQQMMADVSTEINDMIRKQEGMTGQRFNELNATGGDDGKLNAIEATDFEKKFLQLVIAEKEKRTEAIKEVNKELATKMVGQRGLTYKKIRAELAKDPELKSRYDAIEAQIKGIAMN